MKSTHERFNNFIDSTGMSKNKFAIHIGTSSALISKLTTQSVDFRTDILTKILEKYPNLNLTWLLTGVGEMYNTQISNALDKRLKFYLYPNNYHEQENFYLQENVERRLLKEIDKSTSDEGVLFRDIECLVNFESLLTELEYNYFGKIWLQLHNSRQYIKGNKIDYEQYKNDFLDSLKQFKGAKKALHAIVSAIDQFHIDFKPFDKENIIYIHTGKE